MSLSKDLLAFLKNPPYLSFLFKKEIGLKMPADLKFRLLEKLKNTEVKFEKQKLDELSNRLFTESSKNFYVVVDSQGNFFVRKVYDELDEFISLSNFPKLMPVVFYESYFTDCLLVVIERKQAEIWMLGSKGLEKLKDIHMEVPERVKYGGLLGFEEKRIRRHVEHHEIQFLKVVKEDVDSLMIKHKLKIGILGVRPDFLDESKRVFDDENKYIWNDITLEEEKEIKILKAVQALKRKYLKDVQEELSTKKLKQSTPSEMLDLLQKNSYLSEIYIPDSMVDFSEEGFYCLKDYYLSQTDSKCAVCFSKMLKVENFMDLFVYKASLNGSKISFYESQGQIIYLR